MTAGEQCAILWLAEDASAILGGLELFLSYWLSFIPENEGRAMAAKKKQTARGRKQDRARVAGRQAHEVGYEAKKTRTSRSAVKKAVKKVGNIRRKVERMLGL